MPSPSIKYPEGVSVGRDCYIRVKQPAVRGRSAVDHGIVGRAPHNVGGGWLAQEPNCTPIGDGKPFATQREAVRAVLQAKGLWDPRKPAEFRVTDKSGKSIKSGDIVRSYRGDDMVFYHVSNGPSEGREAKVIVDGIEFYASVFDLDVREVA